MIKLILFSLLYLGNFSHINSLSFTGSGFCAATGGGVFVYSKTKGIIASYLWDNAKLAAYDPASKEVAFYDGSNTLYVYSPFFQTVRKIGYIPHVVGIGFRQGILILIFSDGQRKYITKYNQPAPPIYIDTVYIARKRPLPLYLKTKNYETPCHEFVHPVSFTAGFSWDYVGTDNGGVYIFDRNMKRLLKIVNINITAPAYKLVTVFDTLYVLHSKGLTKISKGYVRSLSTGCFQYGFSPVDILYSDRGVYIIIESGYYLADDPYFYTAYPQNCKHAVNTFSFKENLFIGTENCIMRFSDDGGLKSVADDFEDISSVNAVGNRIYYISGSSLWMLQDTTRTEVFFEKEPIIASKIINGYMRLYVSAKRGMFVIESDSISLVRSPFSLLDVKSGVATDEDVYFALYDKVIRYNLARKNWTVVNTGGEKLEQISDIALFDGRLFIGYLKGVFIK